MSQELYSVRQVARSYRPPREDCAQLRARGTPEGRPDREAIPHRPRGSGGNDWTSPSDSEPVRRHRHVEFSSIVEIDAISPEASSRVTNFLVGAASIAEAEEGEPLHIETIYDEVQRA